MLALVLGGCAHGYTAIETSTLNYEPEQEDPPLTFTDRADALEVEGNDGFDNKAEKENVYPAALRVTNTGDEPVVLTRRRLLVDAPNADPLLVPARVAADDLGQAYGYHVLWGLLNVFVSTKDGTTIPIGPVIGVINLVKGANANSDLERDFERKSLYGTSVAPGETVEGLVFVSFGYGQDLTFSYDGGS